MGQDVRVQFKDANGNAVNVDATNPLPVDFGVLTTVTADQGAPNTPSNAWPVKITDGTNVAAVSAGGEIGVVGPLTDAELRATPVPVDGPLTDAELRASAVPVSGPLTDAELRATAVPVSGPLTDAELRASAVPVSAASLPLPSGAATETTLSSIDTKTPALVSGRVPVDGSGVTQPISAASLPLPTGAATSANQTTANSSLSSIDGKFGSLGQKAMAGSAPVVIASDQSAIPASQSGTWTVQPGNTANSTPWLVSARLNDGTGSQITSNLVSLLRGIDVSQIGRSPSALSRINYTSTPVSTSAYTQVLASTTAIIREVEIFDSSGQSLVLAFGAASSEVDQVYVFPGGNGRIPLYIPGGTRVSIKAVSAAASSGELLVNFYA